MTFYINKTISKTCNNRNSRAREYFRIHEKNNLLQISYIPNACAPKMSLASEKCGNSPKAYIARVIREPTIFSRQKCEEYEGKDVPGQPPPGHTRGKWVPGARADIGPGYWCSPCGRKLASRLVYNRHLLSDLHARRSIQEIDGALQMSRPAGPLVHQPNLSRRQRALASVRILLLPTQLPINV